MNVYDFDGTIYLGDSSIDFYKYALKKKPSLIRFIPHQAVGFFLYAIKKIGKTELKEYFFSFLKGIDGVEFVKSFWKENLSKIQNWYFLQQKEDDIVISASPEFLLIPICDELKIKNIIATQIDIKTGKASGENCKGEEKVNRLYEKYPDVNIDSFYSDSNSDKPLAELAEKAYLIKDGKILEWEHGKNT